MIHESSQLLLGSVDRKKSETFDNKKQSSIGPGHYNPKIEVTKPQKMGNFWSKSKSSRSPSPLGHNFLVPGPGQYYQNQDTIEVRQLENKMKNEFKTEK